MPDTPKRGFFMRNRKWLITAVIVVDAVRVPLGVLHLHDCLRAVRLIDQAYALAT